MTDAMSSGTVPEASATPEQTDAARVVADVRTLLSSERLTDAVDRDLCSQAITFLESPAATTDRSALIAHGLAISEVMLMMSDVPPEINALYLHLTRMQCRLHLEAARAELRQQVPNTSQASASLARALNVAKILAKGGDTALLQEVDALQRTMNDPVQEGRPVVQQQVQDLQILDLNTAGTNTNNPNPIGD